MNPNHNPDHNIDRVLHALRDITPPSGIERRILNLLEAQANRVAPRAPVSHLPERLRYLFGVVIPSEAKRSRGIPVFCAARATRLLRWTPLAALTVATLVTLATRRHTPAAIVPTTHQLVTQAPTPQPIPITTIAQPGHDPIAPARRSQPHRIQIAQHKDIASGSHPAAALPLTEQERLLLFIAHRQPPLQLAGLTAEQRAARSERERVDFENFFAPPVMETTDDATPQQ
jgi:hypothetical protein